jgi:hypothetical protein
MLKLGFSGKPRSGKDTAAAAIKNSWPDFVKVYSISDLICAELGLVRDEVTDVSILQNHSNFRCAKDSMYWTKQILSAIQRDKPKIAILSNVRRFEEAEKLRLAGFVLVRFTRLNHNGSFFVANDRDMNDALETELDLYNFDFHVISKTGQVEWIQHQAVSLVKTLWRLWE